MDMTPIEYMGGNGGHSHWSVLPDPMPGAEPTCPCLSLLLVVPAQFSVLSFAPLLPLPALLLFFEECSLQCSWPHTGPSGD